MGNLNNNLFKYATSELSQDAFLCYLASFALEEYKSDDVLKACAKDLLNLFVQDIDAKNVVLKKIERQWKNIDVLLTAICDGVTYKIIIEDKVFSSEHSNQLIRYKDEVCKAYSECKVYGVYYKTGFQCDMRAMDNAKYKIIDRKVMLNFLNQYVHATTNQIIKDYYEYWNDFQIKSGEYKNIEIKNWSWHQRYGFFEEMKEWISKHYDKFWVGYNYVPNRSGGFDGLWFGTDDHMFLINEVKFALYLQIEMYATDQYDTYFKICLKMSSDNKIDGIRDAMNKIIYNENGSYRFNEYHFVRPKTIRSGHYMTIGVFECEPTKYEDLKNNINHAILEYNKILSELKMTEV